MMTESVRAPLTLASLLRAVFISLLVAGPALAQHSVSLSEQIAHVAGHERHDHTTSPDAWEGSAQGIAYSERNHHVAGLMVIVMGLAELSHVLRLRSLPWARLLLPGSLMIGGVFLMIWSDHEAWPIGSLTFVDTFTGGDHEILQHKVYGLLAMAVGTVELLRRSGRIGHRAWASPLPLMAIVGGMMLFGHSHGLHPSAQKIAIHHAIMGTMALTAGSSKLVSAWAGATERLRSPNWEWIWVGLILLIGAQLLVYAE